MALLVDAVGPAVPRLHADKALGILLPEHTLVEGLIGVHRDLMAVALVGEGHGELHAGHQADGVVCALLAGEGDLFRGSGLLTLGILGAGGALDVKVHIFQRRGHEIGVVAEAEGHGLVALVDDGQADEGLIALEVVVHQQGEVEGVEELGQRGGFQRQRHAVRADALHVPSAQVGEAMGLHGVGLALKVVDAAVGVAAAGEEHRHAEAGAVALREVGAAGPDILVAVEGKAGDHAAALGGDGQAGLGGGVGDDVLLIAGTVLGDVLGGDLVHSSVLRIFLVFLVFRQFFKIIIDAVANKVFDDADNNADDRRINKQCKNHCSICS